MILNNRTILTCILVAALGATGCTRKQERAAQSQQESPMRTPGDSGAPVSRLEPETGAVADTAESVAEIFSRIHEHESSLSQIVVAGRWNELATETSRIRDLLAAAAKVMRVPPDQQAELEGHLSEARRLSRALGDAGKAGDVDGSKSLNADLQKELGSLERMAVPVRGPNVIP